MPTSPQAFRIEQLRLLIEQTNEGKNPAGRRTLTDALKVKGGLFFGGIRALTELPDDLVVVGDFNLRATGLRELPANLKVFGSLHLAETAVTCIPDSLKVYGNLDIRKTAVKVVGPGVCWGQILRTQKEFDNASNRINPNVFAEVTGMGTVPEMLLKLFAFQDQYGFESYCNGFGIYPQTPDVFRNWTASDDLAGRLFCIGQANGSGSLYALWKADDAQPLEAQPVVAFGDEGGAWVVASNMLEFFKLLSFDSEPSVTTEDVSFPLREEESPNHQKLVKWLKAQFGIAKVKKADEVKTLVEEAQRIHQHRIDAEL
jgi:hypothetical protein